MAWWEFVKLLGLDLFYLGLELEVLLALTDYLKED